MLKKNVFFALGVWLLFAAAPLFARSWQEIRASGKLRVLTTDTAREQMQIRGLPRRVMPIDREQALLESFARSWQLQIEYVRAPDFKALFPMLKNGQGDLISANLADTPERREEYLLSIPFAHTREIVFTSENSKLKGNNCQALVGSTVVLLPGTTYAANFRRFAEGKKGVKFRELTKTIPHDELIEQVASGKISCSVLNESSLDSWLAYRKGIRKLFPLRSNVPLVFAVSSDGVELVGQLDEFIRNLSPEALATPKPAATVPDAKPADPAAKTPAAAPVKREFADGETCVADLDYIRRRGYIRMLTTNDAFGCFMHKGQLMGFEYELAQRFSEGIPARVSTVMVQDLSELCQFLIDGKGDFIAANFSLTPERVKKYPQLIFCTPYGSTTQVVIGRSNEKISSVADLNGRRVYVRSGSNCHDSLLKLQQSGIRVEIVPLTDEVAYFVMLSNVSEGKFDLAAMDDTHLSIAAASGYQVKKLLALREPESFVWVVRKNNPKLAAAINAFFTREHKSTFYNLCYRRYYGAQGVAKVKVSATNKNLTSISPYDAIFQKYAALYGFNWYVIAAQSYQESRFVPTRVNHVGAAGLMQVMPATAKELGISNLTNPDNGVHAGTKYLAKLYRRFDSPSVAPKDQLCFALASYNAGYGHVQDARILAAQLGLNADVWFGNTEKALALLESPTYATRAKFGYCRASETIPYVANIMLQSRHYESLLPLQKGKSDSAQKPPVKGKK